MKLSAIPATMCLLALVLALPLAAQTDAERAMELREEQQREWIEQTLELREEQQREWIEQTRGSYQEQFRAQERACYQRFAVNDCLLKSRGTEREVMADLRRQDILINDAQRKRRAARQLLQADKRLDGTAQP